MNTSPLKFAQNFEKLKSQLLSSQEDDLKLLILSNYWTNIQPVIENSSYKTYVDEYSQFIKQLISKSSLFDLSPDELNKLYSIILKLSLDDCGDTILNQMITIYCYVGEFDLALGLYYKHKKKCSNTAFSFVEESNRPPLLALKSFCNRLVEYDKQTAEYFLRIYNDWSALSESLSQKQVYSLFVLKSDNNTYRGRMKILEGSVEVFDKAITNDEIAFDNQIKTPDDPFVGAVYNSLMAIRNYFLQDNHKDKFSRNYHGHFSIKDSKQSFTGDSIGLAAAIITYTQLLQSEVYRNERFLSKDIAFTGTVDITGNIKAVNSNTIQQKVERAFFSHVKYIVLPEENINLAYEKLNELLNIYSNRHLQLIPVKNIHDVINNKNIIRSEKVCMGEFTVKTIYKYSKKTKLTIPLLIIIAYFCLCVMIPKARFWFDWNPVKLSLTKHGIEIFNRESQFLWSKTYACDAIEPYSKWIIEDIDEDGYNEIAVIPSAPYQSPCIDNAYLFVYEENGDELFRRFCGILDKYPGDTSVHIPYRPNQLHIKKIRDSLVILTAVNQSRPTRTHYRFWSAGGDSLGWYINEGADRGDNQYISSISGIGFVITSVNNTMRSACLFALDPFKCEGISPPYKSVSRNQLTYMIFPPSDVNRFYGYVQNGPENLRVDPNSMIKNNVYESEHEIFGKISIDYFIDPDNNFRVYKASPEDGFIKTRETLIAQNQLPDVDLNTYSKNLLETVMYWTDSGWVSEGDLRAMGK